MASHSQPETHTVLLAIAAAAFIVLIFLGINLYTQPGHLTADSTDSHVPVKSH